MAKKIAIGTVVVFIFVFVFDWILHGMLLSGIYKETSSIWRPSSEMQTHMKWMMLSQILFALFMCLNFSRAHECDSVKGGVKFGLYMGGIFMALNIGMYSYLPLPSLKLPILWSIGGFLQSIGIGVILSLFCCRKK